MLTGALVALVFVAVALIGAIAAGVLIEAWMR